MTVYWLLDLTVDGHVYRLAEVDLNVTKDDGTTLHYTGGIEVDPVTESLSLISASTTQPEAQVRLWVDGLSTLAILRARGELARWVDGTTWERRRRVLVGACQSPEMESPEEGISTTISQDVWRDSATMIGATQTVSIDNWAYSGQIASLSDGDQALAYPILIGRPGRAGTSSVPAAVLPWLRHDVLTGQVDADGVSGCEGVALMLAAHHVAATQVRLSTETYPTGYDFRVLNTYDDAGHPVAVVPFFYNSDLVPEDIYGTGQPYHFGNDAVTPTIYGLGHSVLPPAFGPDDTQPSIYAALRDGAGGLVVGGLEIRAAGDVLAWALSQSTSSVDRLGMAEVQAALQSYQIDTVIAVRAESKPWDWVAKVLLPILPVSLAAGPDGIFAVPLLLDAVAADAVARLDTRRSDIEARKLSWDTSQLVRSVTVKSHYNVKTGVYTHSITYADTATTAAASTSTTIRAHPSLDLARAWGLDGEDLVIETGAVYDDATAYLVAYTLARVRGLPLGRMEFDLPEADPVFFALRRGAVVYCYDLALDIDRMGQVESIETTGDGSLMVGVLFVLDPSRDTLS